MSISWRDMETRFIDLRGIRLDVRMAGPSDEHWDGDSFTESRSYRRTCGRIAARSPNEVWTMFYGEEVRRYDGTRWIVELRNSLVRNMLGVRGAGGFVASGSGHIYQSR